MESVSSFLGIMDAVEVDIELFVTCRLCLDEKGTYQVIPSVQQQIKYCFDINIDTFDGLPQLLCKKCKDVLNDFYATKTKYRDIQNTLKDKLQKKPLITNIESLKVEEKSKNTDGVEYPIEEKSSKEKKIKPLKIRKGKLEITNIESLKVKEKSNNTNGVEYPIEEKSSKEKKIKPLKIRKRKLEITNIESLNVEEKSKNTDGVEYPIEEKSSKEKKFKRLKILKRRLEVKKKRILSFSSSSESPEPSESLNYLTHVKDEQENHSQVGSDVRYAWEEKYNKYFVCHICKKECEEVYDIETHMKTHNDLIAGHSNLFRTTCKINLNKINEKSNFIGLSTAVVYNEDLIVRHLDGFNYYIVYKNKKKLSSEKKLHEFLNRRKRIFKSCSKFNDSNDADTYENLSRTKPKKCRGSRSSTETVIVCNNIKAQCDTDDSDNGNKLKDDKRLVNETPFIVIDDTSTESLCVDDTHHTNDEETKRTIKEVVNKTYEYVVSQDNNKTKEHRKNQIEHSESQLNHKILTIGTKVINKQDLPSTGLLSYLEMKPLEVKWISRNKANVVNARTFVQDTSVVPESWENVKKNDLCRLEVEKTNVSVQNVEDSENVRIDAMTTDAKDSHVDVDKSVTVAPDCVEKINVLFKKKSDVLAISKISNSNPVTLPKSMDVQKSNTEHKVKQKPVENNVATVKNEAVVCIDLIDDTENEDLKHVPVITHENLTVTSDKPKEVENQNNITDTMPQQESKENCLPDMSISNYQYPPRIKVKSFSELMPEEPDRTNVRRNHVPDNNLWRGHPHARVSSDCRYQCETPLQSIPNNSPVGFISQPQNISQKVPIQRATNQLAINSSSNSGTGFLVLHKEQIPKTMTDSPFQYFRDVLKKNEIYLMKTNSPLCICFKCFGRAKLIVKQEQITKFLKISLWCQSDSVCINVEDEHNTPLDVNMINSDWQWEILQLFKCDIMDKIIKCALKLNGEVHRNICKFKDVLHSIKRHPM